MECGGERMRWATFCRRRQDTAPSTSGYDVASSATVSCTPVASNSTTALRAASTTSKHTRHSCFTAGGRTVRNPLQSLSRRPRCRVLEMRCLVPCQLLLLQLLRSVLSADFVLISLTFITAESSSISPPSSIKSVLELEQNIYTNDLR